jgi:hypothetical protein
MLFFMPTIMRKIKSVQNFVDGEVSSIFAADGAASRHALGVGRN